MNTFERFVEEQSHVQNHLLKIRYMVDDQLNMDPTMINLDDVRTMMFIRSKLQEVIDKFSIMSLDN